MNPATLDQAGIAKRIPHSGRMCLLHTLQAWDAQSIRCTAISHRDANHPLRTENGLLAPVAIEYAAQAMALHGGLHAAACMLPVNMSPDSLAPDSRPTPGFLAAVRGVKMHVLRLDDVPGSLVVSAQRLAGDDRQALYRFTLHSAAGQLLVEGRATVILNTLP